MSADFFPEFCDQKWLHQALTHRSYVNEHPEVGEDNERLEHVGDGILNVIISTVLFRRYPQYQEGTLTQERSLLVSNINLAQIARAYDLGKHLRLGKGVDFQGGRNNPTILSGALEALIGAYFLDSGFDAAEAYVQKLFFNGYSS